MNTARTPVGDGVPYHQGVNPESSQGVFNMLRRSRTIMGWLAACTVLLLGACNTIEGIGEDLSAIGRGIADAAEGAQNSE